MYTLDAYVADLRRITGATSDYGKIFDQVAPLAGKLALAKDTWLTPELYETDAEQGFGAHLLHVEPDNSLAVFCLAWAPDRGTPAHDHGTWTVVAGVEGNERNIKYNRLDDRSKPEYAELEERNSFVAEVGDVVCIKPNGIHLVWNDTDEVTISLHTYGHHFNYTERSQFDPETNVVTPFVVNVR